MVVHRALIVLACIASQAFAFSPPAKRKSPASKNVRGTHSQSVRRSDTSVYGSIKQRLTFNSPPVENGKELPKLILISGCPGTGEHGIITFYSLYSDEEEPNENGFVPA